MRRALRRMASALAVVQFAARSQMNFGGAPLSTLRYWKSESLDTMVKL